MHQSQGHFALVLYLLFACTLPSPAFADPWFQDISEQVGISYSDISWGAAWADVNGDGYPDVWLGNHNRKPRLYISNRNGGFQDQSRKIPLRVETCTALLSPTSTTTVIPTCW